MNYAFKEIISKDSQISLVCRFRYKSRGQCLLQLLGGTSDEALFLCLRCSIESTIVRTHPFYSRLKSRFFQLQIRKVTLLMRYVMTIQTILNLDQRQIEYPKYFLCSVS